MRPPARRYKAAELGICPVTTYQGLNGAHGGKNAGRACWVVAGSLCGGKIQGTCAQKLHNCWRCDFMNTVKKDEDPTPLATVFDVGEWTSAVASRKNDDGTTSFLTIDPTHAGFEFVVADQGGKRRLVTRDAQHEYVFEEAAVAAEP